MLLSFTGNLFRFSSTTLEVHVCVLYIFSTFTLRATILNNVLLRWLCRDDDPLFFHSTPVKPGHIMNILLEELDLNLSCLHAEGLPPSGSQCKYS